MKTKKPTFKQFEANCRKAASYVNNYDKARWIIAELCMEVCDYSHGGRKGESIFTISKFAEAIEIDRKTLYEWCRIKRVVVDKLPKTIQAKISTESFQDIRETLNLISDDSTPKDVYNAYKTVKQRNPDEQKFIKYNKHLKSVLYAASKPLMTKDVPKEVIEEMIKNLNAIKGCLTKELEFRDKFGEFKHNTKRLNIKDEVAERMKA